MAAPGPWTFTTTARTKILDGTLRLTQDTWKAALFLSTSNLSTSSTTYAGVTNQHANANGYTTGGVAVTFTLSGTTTVSVNFTTPPSWLASGGSIVARFAVIYEVSGDVLCYALLDSTPADVTTSSGSILLVTGSPVLSLA